MTYPHEVGQGLLGIVRLYGGHAGGMRSRGVRIPGTRFIPRPAKHYQPEGVSKVSKHMGSACLFLFSYTNSALDTAKDH